MATTTGVVEEVSDRPAISSVRPRARLALALAFVSGLTSLAYQVLWTRLLAVGTGNSTYVFTTILAVFLIGLAGGAVAYAWMRPRIRDVVGFLALGQVLVAGLIVVGMANVIGHHVTTFLPLTSDFGTLLSGFLGPVAVVVLPATFVMGLTFPAAASLIADPSGRVATNSGFVLAANTVGAIIGTFAVPFVVIPALGSSTALGMVALVNAGLGIVLALRARERLPRFVTGGAGVAVAGFVVVALVSHQVFLDPNVGLIESNHGQIVASHEDEIASVQAGQVGGFKQLWVTGNSMTIMTVDAKLMPLLPLMLRPSSTRELTIAFGMGTAYRAALIAGLRSDVVELVPSVPSMFGAFYPDASQVLADPNGRVIIADGRNHVELTDQTYDIIVVDPPPPIESSGVSVIADVEFYRAARARLNAGGVMMEWTTYGQSLDEYKAHVRSFLAAFSNVIIARGPGGYGFYMLGSDQPISFDDATVRAVLQRPGVIEDVGSAFDAPAHTVDDWARLIPSLVLLSGDQVKAFAGDGPLITDDHPLPEYFLLRHTFGKPGPGLSPGNIRVP
jgi:predicted membrane-bound spermidine synthase